MTGRRQLPIRQRHPDDGRKHRDGDGCPWTFRVRLPDGTMPRVTRDSYTAAEAAYFELMSRRPEPLDDKTTTIAAWAERWMESGPSRGWRRNTMLSRQSTMANHILPELGHYVMTKFRRDDARLWAARMEARGVPLSARVLAAGTLHTMYSHWLSDGHPLSAGNPVPSGLVKPGPRKEFTPLTVPQVDAVAAAMPAEMALMVRIEAFYGARLSELLALRDTDVIFTGKDTAAPLGPQLARLAALPGDKYGARKPGVRWERKFEMDGTVGAIKNARGNRTLPLPRWLAAALAAQLEKWPPVDGWLFVNRDHRAGRETVAAVVSLADVAKAAGLYEGTVSKALTARPYGGEVAGPTRDRVKRVAAALGFGRGQPYGQQTYRNWINDAVAKAGVTLPPGQCTHAFRHHCVSVLRDRGFSDQDIGYWIGDSPMTVTKVYGRPMPDALDRIAAELSTAPARLRAVE